MTVGFFSSHMHTRLIFAAACSAICLTIAPIWALAQQDKIEKIIFDIPSEPLSLALNAFSMAAGQGVLVDESLTSGRRSAAVKGTLSPSAALAALLTGTGLMARYVGARAFTLAPQSKDDAASQFSRLELLHPTNREGADYHLYFGAVQAALKRALCKDDVTRPGHYRAGMRLWVGQSGAVAKSELLSSTGDQRRDVALARVLSTLTIDEPPPANLPLPVTVILMPRSPEAAADCTDADPSIR
jgi:Secretin and TonB N terminus short domain